MNEASRKLLTWITFPLAFLLLFAGVSRAAAGATGEEGSLLDLARPVWDAIMHGQYWLAASLALVVAVTLFKRYGHLLSPKLAAFSHSDAGGALMTLLMAFGGALATGLAAVGVSATLSMAMAWTALKIALTAAGGYTLIRKLIVEPVLKPLAAKAPPWLQRILELVFFLFDKPQPIKDAEAAGDAAVAANPAGGLTGTIGKPPTEIQ